MTPAEGALYLGVPNLLMVGFANKPEPPFDQYLISFRPFQRVIWSIISEAASDRVDLDEVISLAEKFPNLCGAVLDDFFFHPAADGSPGRVSVSELARFRERLRGGARPLELWLVLYDHQLHLPLQPYFELCDVVMFWTWQAKDLAQLEENLAKLEALAPGKRIVLGCYLWDYGGEKEMPVEAMQRQCELGGQWLQSGRIEGLIFLSNNVCDMELPSVEFVRRWIVENGDAVVVAS